MIQYVAIRVCLSTVASVIEFEARNVSVTESDGSVAVNLVKIGNHSNNITVCINVIRAENSDIIECNFILICAIVILRILHIYILKTHSCYKYWRSIISFNNDVIYVTRFGKTCIVHTSDFCHSRIHKI